MADAEATGTIANTDPLPQAWLARFGRTAADQAMRAVSDRLAEPGATTELRLGGLESYRPVSEGGMAPARTGFGMGPVGRNGPGTAYGATSAGPVGSPSPMGMGASGPHREPGQRVRCLGSGTRRANGSGSRHGARHGLGRGGC